MLSHRLMDPPHGSASGAGTHGGTGLQHQHPHPRPHPQQHHHHHHHHGVGKDAGERTLEERINIVEQGGGRRRSSSSRRGSGTRLRQMAAAMDAAVLGHGRGHAVWPATARHAAERADYTRVGLTSDTSSLQVSTTDLTVNSALTDSWVATKVSVCAPTFVFMCVRHSVRRAGCKCVYHRALPPGSLIS